ncbi:MAG TPA: septum formation initiator family protein [Chloroflexota bacterium]|nr:septum formation initiator family protein [Chloroflexota bacterium]
MRTSLGYLRRISPMQILLLLVLTVALYFAAAFAGELIASHRINQQVASLTSEIDRLRADNTHLKAAVAEASSDAFVERQARDELGLVRPGDTPVVVANAPVPAPPPPAPSPTPTAHWEKWRDLLAPAP